MTEGNVCGFCLVFLVFVCVYELFVPVIHTKLMCSFQVSVPVRPSCVSVLECYAIALYPLTFDCLSLAGLSGLWLPVTRQSLAKTGMFEFGAQRESFARVLFSFIEGKARHYFSAAEEVGP